MDKQFEKMNQLLLEALKAHDKAQKEGDAIDRLQASLVLEKTLMARDCLIESLVLSLNNGSKDNPSSPSP